MVGFKEWRPAGSGIRYGRNVSVEGLPIASNLADSSGFAGRCVRSAIIQPKSLLGKVMNNEQGILAISFL
jgi:hypothetical protein